MKNLFNKILLAKLFVVLFSVLVFASCNDEDTNTLSVSLTQVEFAAEGGSKSITINTDAPSWNLTNPAADWLTLSSTTGTQPKAMVSMSISTKTLESRTATLVLTAGNAAPINIVVTQPSSEYLYFLTSTTSAITFKRAGETINIDIATDAPALTIQNPADWLAIEQVAPVNEVIKLKLTTPENTNAEARTTTITVGAEFAPSIQITITQKGEYYPSYNTNPIAPDATGMSSSAAQLAQQMVLGWNIGNTLEAAGGETAWGNPKVTQRLIDTIKANGFNSIRIPCTWNQYMANSATAQIKETWLARVKEVVDYCYTHQMYVLLNIHYDGGWLEKNCTPAKQEEVNAKQKAFWEQIATYFRDYDEHLLFASANEPDVSDATGMAVLNSYHQTFIDAVRSTGGRNAYRVLVVQGPATDITKTNKLMKTMPIDNIPNKLMAEVHYYTPWNFCGMEADATWGKMFYYWGKDYHSTTDTDHNATYGEESDLDALFALMKAQFVDKGIPVVLGEYGAIRRSNLTGEALTQHLASRAYFLQYTTKQAKAMGLIPFYWDNGFMGNNGFAVFNRQTNSVFDQQALDALVSGANQQ